MSTPARSPSRATRAATLGAVIAIFAFGGNAIARPLEDIRTNGEISVCANPDALPYASRSAKPPGFQIEIARALAEKLGVRLQIAWIIPTIRASTVDCDLLMDAIVAPDYERRGVKLSIPYQSGGVVLAFAPGQAPVATYKALAPGMRVGIIVNSLASLVVSKTPARMFPFGYEDDIIEGLVKGEVQAGAVSTASIGYYNLQNPDKRLQFTHAEDSEPELKWALAVGMRRADAALEQAVNAALSDLISAGTIEAIYARYGVDYRKP